MQSAEEIYCAEEINENFIKRIVYYATLAPSPHNVQGWKFEFKDKILLILQDELRSVQKELDPNENETLISFGALLVNLKFAAHEFGFNSNVRLFPDKDERKLIATVIFEKHSETMRGSKLKSITDRTINRSIYKNINIQHETIEQLKEIANSHDCKLVVIDDKNEIKALAKIAGYAGKMKLAHKSTHTELYSYLRFDTNDCVKYRDGLSLEHFHIPRFIAKIARYGMRWASMSLFNHIGYNSIISYAQETRLINSAPIVCFLVSRSGERIDFLTGGQVFQKIALLLTELGISMHPHSSVSELHNMKQRGYFNSVPECRQAEAALLANKLEEYFDVNETSNVITFFRIGYATKNIESHTTRRRIQDVLTICEQNTQSDLYYRELTHRNFPFISHDNQIKLKKARISVAGCGSIGGAPVEMLVRMGAENLVLAEPGTFELNNLNRQQATINDIGLNKAEVIFKRVNKINPFVQCEIFTDGVTIANIDYLVGSSDVVIDGIDISEKNALLMKLSLHQEASRRKVPIISGYDIAGTQLIIIYDYRVEKNPLRGKFMQVNTEKITALQFLSRVISPLDVPYEMIPALHRMINSPESDIPQLGPTAELFSVMCSWAVFDIVAGKKLNRRILIDIPSMLRTNIDSMKIEVKRIALILQLKIKIMTREI